MPLLSYQVILRAVCTSSKCALHDRLMPVRCTRAPRCHVRRPICTRLYRSIVVVVTSICEWTQWSTCYTCTDDIETRIRILYIVYVRLDYGYGLVYILYTVDST